MNPAPLQIGDYVKIIGPNVHGHKELIGNIMKIHAISDGNYEGENTFPYPATSLRKVRIVDEDELQIGDRVEIIGQNVHNNSLRLGQCFVIEQIIIDKKYGTMYSAPGQLGFPASSLRKLSPAERGELAGQSTRDAMQKIELSPEAKKKINAALLKILYKGENLFGEIDEFIELQMEQNEEFDRRLSAIESYGPEQIPAIVEKMSVIEERAGIQEKCIHEAYQRISAIESQQADINSWMDRFAKAGAEWEKRLALVEAFQKEWMEQKTLPHAETVGEAFQGHIDKINEALEPVAEEIRKDPDFLHKILQTHPQCHRNPKITCFLDNVVNRMDCTICEQVAEVMAKRMLEEVEK